LVLKINFHFQAGRKFDFPAPGHADKKEGPMRRSFHIFFLLLTAALLFAARPASPALAGVSVVFPPENSVSGARIIVGDVANVVAETPEDKALADLIGGVDLGPAPEPGAGLVLRRRQIELRLASTGAPIADVRWVVPETVTLTGPGQPAGRDMIKQVVMDYLSGAEPYVSGSFELLNVTSSTPPALPPGRVEYRFSPQNSSNPAYLTGTVFFTVDGRDAGRLRVSAQVELSLPSLVVTRDLPRGHVLSEVDLSESQVSYMQAKGALTEVGQALGQTLKIALRAGAPVRDRDLIRTSMVKKGEVVTIVAQSGGLKITALGQARQDGALGQTINVLNQDSKKTISAKVIGPSMVEVVF
jgi:flagella basal body P-ring formation protein FlgA